MRSVAFCLEKSKVRNTLYLSREKRKTRGSTKSLLGIVRFEVDGTSSLAGIFDDAVYVYGARDVLSEVNRIGENVP